jgi:cyclohexanecarboxylate-CoA ligase
VQRGMRGAGEPIAKLPESRVPVGDSARRANRECEESIMHLDPFIPERRARRMREAGWWRDVPFLSYFDRAVAERPELTAIVDNREQGQVRRFSYRELDRVSRRIAANLWALGVRHGDVVAFQLPNWWEFVAIHLACLRIRATSNPLMPIFRERELSFMLDYARAKVVIVPKLFRRFDHEAMLRALAPKLPHMSRLVIVGGEGADAFDKVLLAEDTPDAPEQQASADDVVQLLYTSGTTGMPKGVMHTSNTLVANVVGFLERLGLSGDDTVYMGSPLAHQTGFLYGMWLPIMLRTTGILTDVWDKDRAWSVILSNKVSFTMGATPFLADLLHSDKAPPAAQVPLRYFVCGGAPIPRALAEAAAPRLGLKVVAVFGMSENGAVTVTPPDAPPDKVFSADGLPLPGVFLRVVDAQGRDLPTGAEGRLLINSASNFVGYLRKPEAYATDDEGWFDSGDLARLDADGYVRITGRSKDIIIRGGENIPVVEVENALYRHPDLVDVAVVAVPHERLGETACCYVSVKPGRTFSLEEMRRYLQEFGMTKNYWPERVEIIEAFPRTASGKVQKYQLREMAKSLAAAVAAR